MVDNYTIGNVNKERVIMMEYNKHPRGGDWMSVYAAATAAGLSAVAPLSDTLANGARWLAKWPMAGARAVSYWLSDRRRRRLEAETLLGLSDRMLEDIGLVRNDVRELLHGGISLDEFNARRERKAVRVRRVTAREPQVHELAVCAVGELDKAA